jgi:hypothetical protein
MSANDAAATVPSDAAAAGAEPVRFTGTLTLQDLLDVQRYHFRLVIRRRFLLLMAAVSVAVAALTLALGGAWIRRDLAYYAILAGCAWLPFGWAAHHRLRVYWNHLVRRRSQVEHTVTVGPDSILASSPARDLRLDWSEVAAVVDTPRGVLVVLPPNHVWFWLPNRLFDHDGGGVRDRARVLKFAVDRGVEVRSMT